MLFPLPHTPPPYFGKPNIPKNVDGFRTGYVPVPLNGDENVTGTSSISKPWCVNATGTD